MGCRVAIDDFGAGYTSFRNLHNPFTFDMVKIDGDYVKNCHLPLGQSALRAHARGSGQDFCLETVAECVETQEDASFLIGEGVKYLQGYFFGRPSLETPLPEGLSGSRGW